ncbi:MAG: glyceraldehyde-3-phosphate dehydrogenase [Rhodobacteraceae bacterium]|nr:glyceraldehyde-3-phosphate dehydrogenase [Paracoccaceae bacterium]
MSNRSAIILACVIILALVLDQVLNAGDATMFLLRKLFDLIEYLAFWR